MGLMPLVNNSTRRVGRQTCSSGAGWLSRSKNRSPSKPSAQSRKASKSHRRNPEA